MTIDKKIKPSLKSSRCFVVSITFLFISFVILMIFYIISIFIENDWVFNGINAVKCISSIFLIFTGATLTILAIEITLDISKKQDEQITKLAIEINKNSEKDDSRIYLEGTGVEYSKKHNNLKAPKSKFLYIPTLWMKWIIMKTKKIRKKNNKQCSPVQIVIMKRN